MDTLGKGRNKEVQGPKPTFRELAITVLGKTWACPSLSHKVVQQAVRMREISSWRQILPLAGSRASPQREIPVEL